MAAPAHAALACFRCNGEDTPFQVWSASEEEQEGWCQSLENQPSTCSSKMACFLYRPHCKNCAFAKVVRAPLALQDVIKCIPHLRPILSAARYLKFGELSQSFVGTLMKYFDSGRVNACNELVKLGLRLRTTSVLVCLSVDDSRSTVWPMYGLSVPVVCCWLRRTEVLRIRLLGFCVEKYQPLILGP